MAKHAANAVLEGLSVDLISTDTERVGAFAQSEAYAKLLELGVRPARDVDTLSLLLDENAARINRSPDRPGKPCFIDTASVNPFDRTEFSNLKRLIDGARVSAGTEPVIVVSATGDTNLLCEVAGTFAQFGARRLIATQVDISRRIGPILAAADASHLAIAQISVTPYLARGLARMNSFVCARLILGSHDRRAEETPISAAS
jgi:flagellar biosynthesis protein FlhF